MVTGAQLSVSDISLDNVGDGDARLHWARHHAIHVGNKCNGTEVRGGLR